MPGADLRENIARIMDDIFSTISLRRWPQKRRSAWTMTFFDIPGWKCRAAAPLKEMARQQLGTVGSGNHYVDLFTDEQDRVWVGVHFGSRGLGHKIATWFLHKRARPMAWTSNSCV